MKIQLLNQSKLKVIFSLRDLEENDISLHAFLSGSKKSIDFIKAVIEIAHEDFDFCLDNKNFSYETFCFSYEEFIIIVSPEENSNILTYPFNCISNESSKNTLREPSVPNNSSFNFIDNQLSNYLFKNKNIYYCFNSLEDFFDFSNYTKSFLKFFTLKSFLYEYKNILLLEIQTTNLSCLELKKLFLFFSEIKTSSSLSELVITHFKEFSNLLISDNALNL